MWAQQVCSFLLRSLESDHLGLCRFIYKKKKSGQQLLYESYWSHLFRTCMAKKDEVLQLKGKCTNYDRSPAHFLNLGEQQRFVIFLGLDCESCPRSHRLCGFTGVLPFSPLCTYYTCHLYMFSLLISIQPKQNLDQITQWF